MSQTVTVQVQITNEAAIREAAQKLQCQYLGHGAHQLYDGVYNGIGVKHPQWSYPWVLEAEKAHFDDFNGRWGDRAQWDAFRQRYEAEVVRLVAEAAGYMYEEEIVENEIHAHVYCMN